MYAFTIIGAIILVFFLWGGSKVDTDEEGNGVTSSTMIGIILIIALAGFLIAAGLFH